MAWCGARPACVEGADRPGEGSWVGWGKGVDGGRFGDDVTSNLHRMGFVVKKRRHQE